MDHLIQEFRRLLRCASNIAGRLHHGFQLIQRQIERRIRRNQLQQIVLQTAFLHVASSLHGERTNLLVQLLTIAACLYCIHHDVLRCHERKLGHQTLLDNLLIYDQTIHNIQVQIQNTVNCEEALRNGQTFIGGVIQRALEPLRGGYQHRVHRVAHYKIREGSDTLAAHRISLICHSGRTDLALFKGLLDLLQMLQQTNIIRELMRALRNTCQDIQYAAVDLTRIGLTTYRIGSGESHLLSHTTIQCLYLLMIPLEQLHKACLCTSGSLCAAQTHSIQYMTEIIVIQLQIHQPERRALANCGRLRRLKMCKTKSGKRLVAIREAGKLRHNVHQLLLHQLQCLRHKDQIGVVADIAGRRTQMNDALCLRTLLTVGIYMRHHIMANLFLTGLCHIIVDVILMSLQFSDLLIRDRQSQFLL